MSDLTGSTISSTYNLLLTTESAVMGSSLQSIQSGTGVSSALQLSSSTVKVAGACVISSGSSDSALDILSTVTEPSAGGNPTIKINANNSTTKGLRFKAENAGGVIYAMQSGGVNALRFGYSTDDSDITESMQIDSAGRVGIGGTPNVNLHITGTGIVAQKIESTDDQAILYLMGATSSDEQLGATVFYNGSDSVASIACDRDGADDAAALIFGTQATGAGLTEAMRIDSSGNVSICTAARYSEFEAPGTGSFTATDTRGQFLR